MERLILPHFVEEQNRIENWMQVDTISYWKMAGVEGERPVRIMYEPIRTKIRYNIILYRPGLLLVHVYY